MDGFRSTCKSRPFASAQQTEILSIDFSTYPAEVMLTNEQQNLISEISTETLMTLDVSQPSHMSAGEYATLASQVMKVLQLAYEVQLGEIEELEIQSERSKTVEQNYHTVLEQLETLQHEKSLHMETPAGELREQVNSLSNTVEQLTSHTKDLEQAASVASQTIQHLEEDKKKLQTKLQEQDTTIQEHNQEIFILQKQASDLRNEVSRVQAVHPSASTGAETAISQQAFLSQMDDLESAYQQQLADLESQLDGVKAENLTLCMELQDVGKEAQKEAQMKSQLQDDLRLAEETASHLKVEEVSLQEELNAQITLLSEIETRFERQVADSQKEIDALRAQLAQSQTKPGLLSGDHSDNQHSANDQLAEAKNTVKVLAAEKIQLLEAYEALELDTGRLIDDAVRKYTEQVDVLNGELQAKINELAVLAKENVDIKACMCDIEAEFAAAQKDLKEVVSGDLQLATALAEMNYLRARLKAVQAEKLQISAERNDLADMAEFYFEESRNFRSKYEPGSKAEFNHWRQQRHSKLAQLEALNAELERMVAELEGSHRRRSQPRMCPTDAVRIASDGDVQRQAVLTDSQADSMEQKRSIDAWNVHGTFQGTRSETRLEESLRHAAKVISQGLEQAAKCHTPTCNSVETVLQGSCSADPACPGSSPAVPGQHESVCKESDASLQPFIVKASIGRSHFSTSQARRGVQHGPQIEEGFDVCKDGRVQRAGQVIATLQAAICEKDRELLRLHTAVGNQATETPLKGQVVNMRSDSDLWKRPARPSPVLIAEEDSSTCTQTSQLDSPSRSQCVHALAQSVQERMLLRQGLENMTVLCHDYQTQLQVVIDQRNMLYRDYAGITAQKKARFLAQQIQADKLANELAAANGRLAIMEAKLNSYVQGTEQSESTAVKAVVLRCKLDRTTHELSRAREAQVHSQRQVEALSWKCRELHVTSRARARMQDSVHANLENRLLKTYQQLLQTVPAQAYFRLLDRHMSVVQDRRAHNSLSDLNSEAFQAHFRDMVAECTFQQRYLDACKAAASKVEPCCQAQLVLSNDSPQLDPQPSADLMQRTVELRVAEADEQLVTADTEGLVHQLSQAQSLNAELQKHLASEAKKLQSAQSDAMEARKMMHGAIQAAEAESLQRQLEELQAALTDTQERLEKHCAGKWLCCEAERLQKQEASRVLAQLSNCKQENKHLKTALLRMQTEASRSATDALKATVVEKDLELNRMCQALTRSNADIALLTQGLEHAQMECATLQARLAGMTKSRGVTKNYIRAMADALLLKNHNTIGLVEQLGLAIADRVPMWQISLISSKLASLCGISEALQGINKGLSEHVMSCNSAAERPNSVPEACVPMDANSVSLFSFTCSAHTGSNDVEMKHRLSKRKNLLLAQEAKLFSQSRFDMLSRIELLEKCAVHMEQEYENQRAADNAQTKHLQSELDLLHSKLCLLDSQPDHIHQHGQDAVIAPIPCSPAHASGCSSMSVMHQNSPVLPQDASLAFKYIESIKDLRGQVAERERECAEATREKEQVQVQHDLVSAAYNELLQRMKTYVHPHNSGSHTDTQGDGHVLQVAAAKTVIRDQDDTLKCQEQELVTLKLELSSVQHDNAARESELLSRIAHLEERLAKQLSSWKEVTIQKLPEGISSVDELIGTIAELKMELESTHKNSRKQEEVWADERHRLLQTYHTTVPNDKVGGRRCTQTDSGGTSAAEGRLRESVAKKDKLVMALRDAIKQLESKLIESEKKHADSVIHMCSSKELDKLASMVSNMKKDKASLELALQAERSKTNHLKRQLADSLQERSDMKTTLTNANEQARGVLEELATAQTQIGRLQQSSEMRNSADAGIKSAKAQKEISALTNRVHVLEVNNTTLRNAAKRNISSTIQVENYATSMSSKLAVPDAPQQLTLTAHPPAMDALKPCDLDETHARVGTSSDTRSIDLSRAATPRSTNNKLLHSTPPHALSREIATLRKRLRKKAEEHTAEVHRGKLKDQRIMMAEKKIQGLESIISKRNTELTHPKDTLLINIRPSRVSGEQMQQVISQIKQASEHWDVESEMNEKDLHDSWNQRFCWIIKLLQEAAASEHIASSTFDAHSPSHAHKSSNHDTDLIAKIHKLQRDLDKQNKAIQNMVPSSKYMQEVTAHKAARKELARMRATSGSVEVMKMEIHQREQQLVRWRSDNASLKRKIIELEATVNKGRGTEVLNETGPEQPHTMLQTVFQKQYAEVCAENKALRSELDAFDPEFFDEIEDLKFERQELSAQVVRYRERIQALASELSIPPDLS